MVNLKQVTPSTNNGSVWYLSRLGTLPQHRNGRSGDAMQNNLRLLSRATDQQVAVDFRKCGVTENQVTVLGGSDQKHGTSDRANSVVGDSAENFKVDTFRRSDFKRAGHLMFLDLPNSRCNDRTRLHHFWYRPLPGCDLNLSRRNNANFACIAGVANMSPQVQIGMHYPEERCLMQQTVLAS